MECKMILVPDLELELLEHFNYKKKRTQIASSFFYIFEYRLIFSQFGIQISVSF